MSSVLTWNYFDRIDDHNIESRQLANKPQRKLILQLDN